MDKVLVGLYCELFKIARGEPELGEECRARVGAFCQQLQEQICSQQLESLCSMQALLEDWAAPRGWEQYGDSPEALRGAIVELLGKIFVEK